LHFSPRRVCWRVWGVTCRSANGQMMTVRSETVELQFLYGHGDGTWWMCIHTFHTARQERISVGEVEGWEAIFF
jgi:hypothetical protein